MMNSFEIEQYMKQAKNFTIPEIQKKFNLKYIDVRRFFKQMEDNHQIFIKKGILFSYNFAIEKTLEKFRKILWNCILENKYNKYDVMRKFNMNNNDIKELENWFHINHYYNFEADYFLITKEEFVNRYGTIKDDKQEKNDDTAETLDDDILNQEITSSNEIEEDGLSDGILKELIRRHKNIDNEDQEDDDDNEDEEDDQFDTTDDIDLLEVDSFKKRYDNILKLSLMKDSSITKAQFLINIKLLYTRCKDNLIFPTRPVFLEIIKNVQDLTEEEFQKLRASIIDKK